MKTGGAHSSHPAKGPGKRDTRPTVDSAAMVATAPRPSPRLNPTHSRPALSPPCVPPHRLVSLDEQRSGAAHRLDNGETLRYATPARYQVGTHTPARGRVPKRRRRSVAAPKTHVALFV
eukprot:scaffold16915_cov69-Phaeocystis_antarctica.AAC.4